MKTETTIRVNGDRRPTKGRVYVNGIEEEPQPTALCVDWDCQAYRCRVAHGVEFLKAVGLEVHGFGWDVGGEWRMPKAEEDHAQWRAWRRRGIARMREAIDAAVEAEQLPPLKVGFSQYAGCGMCPCSPGFVVQGEALWDRTATVKVLS